MNALNGVSFLTLIRGGGQYEGVTSARTCLRPQAAEPTLKGVTAMTKFVLAAVAALSLLASPVLAGPGRSWDDVVQKSGDFQLQGR